MCDRVWMYGRHDTCMRNKKFPSQHVRFRETSGLVQDLGGVDDRTRGERRTAARMTCGNVQELDQDVIDIRI